MHPRTALQQDRRKAEAGNGGVKEHLLLTRYSPKRGWRAAKMMSVTDVKEILGLDVGRRRAGICRRAVGLECRHARDPQ